MNAASEALEFEKAIEYRELINSIKKVSQKQKNYRFQRGGQGCSGCCIRR